MAEVSKLKLCSIGIVAQNKPLNTRIVEIALIEDSIMTNGEINEDVFKYTAKGVDDNDKNYQHELDTTHSTKATWLPMGGGNRHTAPDVRRGERVAVYRFGDNDEFWWTTLRDNLELRKLETVIWAFSGTRVEDIPVSSKDYYFFEVSTHKKLIHLSTSKADGETWKHDIQINTEPGQGFIKIEDDDGQFIILDSKERQIIAQNRDKSKVDINKREIFIEAADLVSVKSRKIYMESVESITRGTNMIRQANNISETANTRTIQANTLHRGNHYVIGTIGATSGFSCGGGNWGSNISSFEVTYSGELGDRNV